jgi:hypothetical protein
MVSIGPFITLLKSYRGSLPYATVGTGENLHKLKVALGKYLANAIFGQFISLLRFGLFVFGAILFHEITQKLH